MSGVLLNLASGTDLRDPPWQNLDVVPRWPGTDRGCDVIWNAHDPLPYGDKSIDGVFAGYLFLHVEPQRHANLIKEIARVMKPGAELTVREIDMEILLPVWLQNPRDPYLSGLVWGEQGTEHGAEFAKWDKHNQGFTEATLAELMDSGGFYDIVKIEGADKHVWYDLVLSGVNGAHGIP